MVFCSHDLKTLWKQELHNQKKTPRNPPKTNKHTNNPPKKHQKTQEKDRKKTTKNPPKTKKTTTNKKIQIQLLNKENDDKGKKIKLMPQRLKNF